MQLIRNKKQTIFLLLIIVIFLKSVTYFLSETDTNKKIATIDTMITVALKPVGSTMYIWGGGWSSDDRENGATSAQIGLSPRWKEFTHQQGTDYDFKEHRFERENGLDCSGYVGWVIYNTFEQEDGKPGYVTTSTEIAQSLAERGWGQLIFNAKKFLPGDIVSMEGHVWICLGTCMDGSVLLVHSSPPGVSVCGTPSPNNSKDEKSIAVRLATEYMEKYQPQWHKKYPNREVPYSYLEEVSVFRWSKDVMKDAVELQKKSAEEIIVYMSPDV